MANEQKQYPRGQVGLGAGDLQQCTDVEFTSANNAKVVGTLRKNPSGIVIGNKAVAITGNSRVDEDGPERDFFDLVDSGKPQQARFKFPGGVTKACTVVVAEVKGSFTQEDGVLQSWTMVGYMTKS